MYTAKQFWTFTSKLSFNIFSSTGVVLPFFVFVFVFSVVAESESLFGVLDDSESSSSAPSSRLVFCAARSISLSETVFVILRLLMLFELKLVDGFLGERRAVDVEREFVEPLLLFLLNLFRTC